MISIEITCSSCGYKFYIVSDSGDVGCYQCPNLYCNHKGIWAASDSAVTEESDVVVPALTYNPFYPSNE